jgi:dCMP deaminase
MSGTQHKIASGKRLDVISWDEFFMSVAIAAQRRSKDPNTQVGACIASTNHRILSVGYNGTPSALNDDFFPWGTSDDPLQDKHNYVVHAEANAVLNYRGSLKDLEGSTVYVTLFPCHDCAKILAQVGVGEVVYLDNKYADTDDGHQPPHPRLLWHQLPSGYRRCSHRHRGAGSAVARGNGSWRQNS